MKQKKLLTFMVIIIGMLVFGVLNVSAESSGTCGDNLTWTLNDSGTLTISGSGSMTNFDFNSFAPWYSNIYSITNIVIKNGVTSIGDFGFFNCRSLKSITIPDSVTSIGDSSFSNCESLTSITIPNSVTSIGNSAFYYCDSLTSITIPNSVTSIGNSTFSNCLELTSITIPNSVTSIGNSVFYDCYKLTSITIPNSVTSIGDYAFYYCSRLKSVIIGYNVTSIGNSAFSNCHELTSITIPNSVTSIGNSAFYDCGELTSIYIPNSVTSIGNSAFYNCDLKSITMPDSIETIGNSVFFGCSFKSVTIPDSVTSIGYSAFNNCRWLTSVTIPNSVTSIGDYAFNHCESLTTVYYNGNQDDWNKISIASHNNALTSLTPNFFWYVNIFSSIIQKPSYMCPVDSIFDFSVLPERLGHTTKIYIDKTLTTEFDVTTPITANTDLYVAYKINQYTYKFADEDGTIIKKDTVDYNSVIEAPENPTKPSNEQYTYVFDGWNGYTEGITQKAEEMVFTAKYKTIVNKCTYKFVDEDGTVLKEESVDYGTFITPFKAPYDKDPYTFDYWDNYTEYIVEDIVFTAVYKYKDYTIFAEGIKYAITVTYNDSFKVEPQFKDGYSFVGYFTEKDGKGEKITNEKGESLKAYDVIGNLNLYPHFVSVYLNKIGIIGETTAMPGDKITQNVIFASDKDAGYLILKLKYPEYLKLTGVKAVDFIEATKDSEEVEDGYTYLDITCMYDYNNGSAPVNINLIPFKLTFDITAQTPITDVEISIEEATLIGDADYIIEDTANNIVTIMPKLAEKIIISGKEQIDGPTKYVANILPEYATNKEVIWKVDDENIATISQDGVLTPIANGKVIIKATATDGSDVFATKTVNIIAYAKINSFDFGSGVCLEDFNPNNTEYTVYVKNNVTTITLIPEFDDGALRLSGGGLWISGRAKEFELNDTKTVITLNRDSVNGMTDNVYTITVIKFEGTKTTVSGNGKVFTIKPVNIAKNKVIILALYNNGNFVELQSALNDCNEITFTTDKEYTNAKIMVWDSMNSLKPIYLPELID